MIVRFYEMTREGEAVVGDLRLEGSVLTADPPDRVALARLINEEFELWDPAEGHQGYLEPAEEPERFLKECLKTYRGSYFWCREIPESTGS